MNLIIGQRSDPGEKEKVNPSCPNCGTWINPEVDVELFGYKVYLCPECGFIGEIEEWYE